MGRRISIPMEKVAIYLLTVLILASTVPTLATPVLHAATTKAVTAKVVISSSTVAKLAKAGKGTPENPYIIELGTVNAKGYTYGVLIENVNNVVIESTKVLYAAKDGIHIVNSTNITIKGVTVSNTQSGTGIYIERSHGVRIIDSSITGAGWWGVGAINSSDVELLRDTVSYNLADGVFMYNVKGVKIENVRAEANGKKGIYLIACSDVTIKNIYVSSSRDGDSLKLQKCTNVVIDEAKLVKAKYWNLCLMGVKNAVIRNVYTTGAGWDGIYVGASYNVTIEHCKFVKDTYKGVFIEMSRNVRVLNNFIEPGMDVGINLKGYCMNIEIANNTMVNASNSGIRVQEGSKVMNFRIVGNKIVNSSVTGIDIASSARNVVIANNTVIHNHHDGIYVYTGSRNVLIAYNNVSFNAKIGIKIKKGVFKVLIEHNVIERNGQWAIYIEPGASNITVRYNAILYNGKHPQAYDDSGATWYCNTWSDFSGKGLYTIAGAAHAVDLKPKTLPRITTTTVVTTSTRTSVTTTTTTTSSVTTVKTTVVSTATTSTATKSVTKTATRTATTASTTRSSTTTTTASTSTTSAKPSTTVVTKLFTATSIKVVTRSTTVTTVVTMTKAAYEGVIALVVCIIIAIAIAIAIRRIIAR